MLFKHDWVIVLRKYVLILCRADALLSEKGLVAGIEWMNFTRWKTWDRRRTWELGKHWKRLHMSWNASNSPEHSTSMQLNSWRWVSNSDLLKRILEEFWHFANHGSSLLLPSLDQQLFHIVIQGVVTLLETIFQGWNNHIKTFKIHLLVKQLRSIEKEMLWREILIESWSLPLPLQYWVVYIQ